MNKSLACHTCTILHQWKWPFFYHSNNDSVVVRKMLSIHSPFFISLIYANKLIEVLLVFIGWQLYWMRLVTQINVTPTKTHYPLPNCAYIHCLISVNIQLVSINVNRCNCFHMEEFNSISLLSSQMPFYLTVDQMQCVTKEKEWIIGRKVQYQWSVHQDPLLILGDNVIK